jgi:CUB/sushi domain-containing protein
MFLNKYYHLYMKVPTVQTTTDLVGMIGTIKSPNYPASYSNSSDYRWKIVTQPNTSIRLLFVLFETQEKYDFVSVC